MEPFGYLYGFATFYGLKVFKKPLRKMTVAVTSQMFSAIDRSKEAAYNVKEEFEDIIAEAHYENMKRKQEREDFKEQESIEMFTEKGGE